MPDGTLHQCYHGEMNCWTSSSVLLFSSAWLSICGITFKQASNAINLCVHPAIWMMKKRQCSVENTDWRLKRLFTSPRIARNSTSGNWMFTAVLTIALGHRSSLKFNLSFPAVSRICRLSRLIGHRRHRHHQLRNLRSRIHLHATAVNVTTQHPVRVRQLS